MMSSLDRLRWLVLTRFNVIPGSEADRNAESGDFLFAGLNMVLDAERGALEDENPRFDKARFEKLRRGGT